MLNAVQVRQLKAHANALADTASQAKLDLAAAKQETASLSDQIVQVGKGGGSLTGPPRWAKGVSL